MKRHKQQNKHVSSFPSTRSLKPAHVIAELAESGKHVSEGDAENIVDLLYLFAEIVVSGYIRSKQEEAIAKGNQISQEQIGFEPIDVENQ